MRIALGFILSTLIGLAAIGLQAVMFIYGFGLEPKSWLVIVTCYFGGLIMAGSIQSVIKWAVSE